MWWGCHPQQFVFVHPCSFRCWNDKSKHCHKHWQVAHVGGWLGGFRDEGNNILLDLCIGKGVWNTECWLCDRVTNVHPKWCRIQITWKTRIKSLSIFNDLQWSSIKSRVSRITVTILVATHLISCIWTWQKIGKTFQTWSGGIWATHLFPEDWVPVSSIGRPGAKCGLSKSMWHSYREKTHYKLQWKKQLKNHTNTFVFFKMIMS